MKYIITEDFIKALKEYLLKSPCPSSEVQTIVSNLLKLEKVEEKKEE